MKTKKCTKCGVVKVVESFSPKGRGYQSHCKACRAAAKRDNSTPGEGQVPVTKEMLEYYEEWNERMRQAIRLAKGWD